MICSNLVPPGTVLFVVRGMSLANEAASKPQSMQGAPTRTRKRTLGDVPATLALRTDGYAAWLADVKARVHEAQQHTVFAVNTELLQLYWSLGRDLSDRRQEWGTGVIEQVSVDLRAAFLEMKGFSPSNLKYMRAFAEAWPDGSIRQQPVGELPWGHNVVLLTRLKARDERLAYARAALTHGWSRNVLDHHIDLRTVERTGKAITNFERQLPGCRLLRCVSRRTTARSRGVRAERVCCPTPTGRTPRRYTGPRAQARDRTPTQSGPAPL
jgi:predicted nuclease of restriction endonuclease-like (RecB) superfamily